MWNWMAHSLPSHRTIIITQMGSDKAKYRHAKDRLRETVDTALLKMKKRQMHAISQVLYFLPHSFRSPFHSSLLSPILMSVSDCSAQHRRGVLTEMPE